MTASFDVAGTKLGTGIHLLEASAGTGKTHALTGIALRLLLEGRVASLGRILMVTFTVAATDELKQRLRSLLRKALRVFEGGGTEDALLISLRKRHGDAGTETLRRALAEFDDLAVFTIHGFCKRVLEQSAFQSGTPFEVEFVEDDIPLQRRAAQDTFRRRFVAGTSGAASAVALAARWNPDTLLGEYRLWRRHPNTRLLPEPGDPEEALAALQAARDDLAAVWSRPEIEALLDELPFKASGDLGKAADRSALLELVDALCRGDGWNGLPEACMLARSELSGEVYKRQCPRLPRHPVLDACGILRERRIEAESALRGAFLREMDEAFAEEKGRGCVYTFDDLLERVRDAVVDVARGPALRSWLRQQYQAVLIDEFQDTDLLQYDIFRGAFGRHPLFLVGDPKQAIYAFRGADVFAYLEARRDAEHEYGLPRNHRSNPRLVRAVQAVFETAHRPFLQTGIGFRGVDPALTEAETALSGEDRPPLQWRLVRHGNRQGEIERAVVADLTDEIVRLLKAGISIGERPLSAGDIAVLTRKNVQAVAVQDSLRRAGVPSVIGKAGDVFDTQEMRDLETLMAAISQPADTARVRAFWASTVGGRTAAEIVALADDPDGLQREYELLEQWRRRWLRHGFVAMVEDVFDEREVRARLLARRDGERRLTNFLQVVEILHQAEMEGRLTPEGLIQWLEHERLHQMEIDYQRRELRLESDADAVQILTVHGAKGLQYEVVFCPFLWTKVYARKPLRYHLDAHDVVLDYRSEPQTKARAEAEEMAEELRLCYVALTRARRRCYVHHVAKTDAARSVLGYLLHQPDPVEDGDWLEAVRDHARSTLARWDARLDKLVAGHSELMEIHEVPVEPRRLELGEIEVPAGLHSRPRPERGTDSFRITSFTDMAAGADGRQQPGSERPDHFDPPAVEAAPPPTEAAGILAFARGARAGRCLHAILERVDFTDLESERTRAVITTELARHRLDRPEHHDGVIDPAAAVMEMLHEVAGGEPPGTGLMPSRLAPSARQNEWQFFVSLARIVPRELASIFADHGRDRVATYGERLRRLAPARLHGFLTGFVDMVCEHDGRFYLYDWKSNHLGTTPGDYGDAALWQCMAEHDYVLQYHLYALALHRHLRLRIPDYDYGRHFGGVCYAFLRGARAKTADGLYFDEPPRALIEAIDEWATDSRLAGGAR